MREKNTKAMMNGLTINSEINNKNSTAIIINE